MAGYDGSLKFDTEISEKGFSSGITKLGSLAKGGLTVLAGAIGSVTAALGAGAVAGMKYNASIETYQTSFEVMTGSAEKAIEVIDRLKKVGAETPFELPDLADTTQLLMNYGLTADEAMDKMMMLGDISQGSADKMSRIAMAYGQMSSAGKVQLEDVKQMIEAGFNPLQEISESTGESMSSLYDRISKGTISVDEITASMERATSAGGKYYQSMQKQSQTFSGMISTLKDNAQQFLGDVVQPISDSMVSTLLPAAIDAIDQMSNAFQTQGVDGLIQSGSQILANVATGIAQGLPELLTLGLQVVTSVLEGFTANTPQIITAGGQILQSLVSGMLQLLPAVGQFMITLLAELYAQITAAAPSLLQKGYELLRNIVDGFVQAIPEALPKILDFIQGIGDKLAEAAPVMIQKGFELLSKLVEGIVTAIPILVSRVPEIISTFANIINDNFPTILMKGVELIGQLVAGIIQAIPTIIANIPQIISAIVDTLQAFNWLNLGKTIITALGNGITSMVGFVKNAGTSILNGIKGAIQNLPSTLANLGKSAIYSLGNTISGLVSYVKTAALKIVSGIESTILSLPGKMLSIGKNIVQGLWNGISDMTGWIIDKISGFGESVLGGIKSFFGIKSPSRLMRDEVGKYLAQGVGVGFEKNIPVKQMTAGMKKAIGKMQTEAIRVSSTMPMTTNVATKAVTNNYTNMQIDYQEIEKAYLRAANKANQKPIILNNREINRALRDGGHVPA